MVRVSQLSAAGLGDLSDDDLLYVVDIATGITFSKNLH